VVAKLASNWTPRFFKGLPHELPNTREAITVPSAWDGLSGSLRYIFLCFVDVFSSYGPAASPGSMITQVQGPPPTCAFLSGLVRRG